MFKSPIEIKLIKELVRDISGKNTEAIVDILKDKRDVNEYKIAEKLKMTVNQIRNILYKLYNQNIASFIRKKDKQRGWYTYYWTLHTNKSLDKFISFKKHEVDSLKHQLQSRENKRFFLCPHDSIEFNEENALLHDFICPECGQLLKLSVHENLIKEMKEKIAILSKEIAAAQQELNKIMAIEVAKHEKKEKKTKKKKIMLRLEKRKSNKQKKQKEIKKQKNKKKVLKKKQVKEKKKPAKKKYAGKKKKILPKKKTRKEQKRKRE